MNAAPIQIRPAVAADASAVAGLAAELAQSFTFSRARFDVSYPALLAERNVCLLVAVGGDHLGYLLGFRHLTFFANGPVGWVEEILIRPDQRGLGTGRALMTTFEQWAAEHDCTMVALATRRAAPFYRAIGYEESAVYHRKILRAKAAPLSRALTLSQRYHEEAEMTDMLIRDVPDDVVAALDAHAGRLGLSRSEYVRRRLAQDAATPGTTVSVEDLARFAGDFGDLADPDVMNQAWQ